MGPGEDHLDNFPLLLLTSIPHTLPSESFLKDDWENQNHDRQISRYVDREGQYHQSEGISALPHCILTIAIH